MKNIYVRSNGVYKLLMGLNVYKVVWLDVVLIRFL